MEGYLKYEFIDSPELVDTFDELPLWSASFGLLLLKHLELRPELTVLDIGSGTGFPLLELAQRLGTSSKCYGLDTWMNANKRGRQKIKNYAITNVEILDSSAENIPFGEASIDLVVSNLGINNFNAPDKVIEECYRVLKPGGRLAITTNLNGHWQEFYNVFEETAEQLKRPELVEKLQGEQQHRGSLSSISNLFTEGQFLVSRHFEDQFEMQFLDGSAFLNHYFIKLGWLSSWKALIPEPEQETVFKQLETNLNAYATKNGGLGLSVPMLYIEAQKV
jgi:arsenite methyltransferase